jgi:hypothetical protein
VFFVFSRFISISIEKDSLDDMAQRGVSIKYQRRNHIAKSKSVLSAISGLWFPLYPFPTAIMMWELRVPTQPLVLVVLLTVGGPFGLSVSLQRASSRH